MTNFVVNFLDKNLIKNISNKRTKHLNYNLAKLPSSIIQHPAITQTFQPILLVLFPEDYKVVLQI